MSKIFDRFFVFLFIFFALFSIFSQVGAADDNSIKIISRSEWGADESYRYKDSSYWESYFDNVNSGNVISETDAEKLQEAKNQAITDYLVKNYKDDNIEIDTITSQNGHELVRPIQKTKYVKSIIVHQTDTTTTGTGYEDSLETIKSIYKYHALTKGRGDIGYNYIIGYNGEIFEGRAGGDYVVGSHTIRNNHSTVGIAVMGNFDNEGISDTQYESLKKLILYLSKKYGIDTKKQVTYHKNCIGSNCSFYITDLTNDSVIGHRDAGLTDCPGDKLYAQLQQIKQEIASQTSGLTYVLNNLTSTIDSDAFNAKLSKLSEHNLLTLLAAVDYKVDQTGNSVLKQYRELIFEKIQSLESSETNSGTTTNFDETNKIKVKLSYPDDESITVKKGNTEYDIKISSGKLLVNDKLLLDKVTINSTSGSYLEISSWSRIPTWDTTGKYNDNKFRGDLILYVENGKLVVVNDVLLSDYLKGLGEVSDSDNTEKIKTIIISARTYARRYMTKATKFPGELYQASDDPDEFQKYLGYSLESRSPNINKIVDETENQVITYNGDIIKPWYFSQSDGKTLSYTEYCAQSGTTCKAVNYPYLTSVFDPGSVGKTKIGHGVGISGAGATYLSSKGWDAEMIIKYFLKGVSIKIK